jgi:hypothetical protein
MEFLTGYLVEEALSVDNLFVFLMIFSYFRVPSEYQHKVLFWGIMGALLHACSLHPCRHRADPEVPLGHLYFRSLSDHYRDQDGEERTTTRSILTGTRF